MDQTEGDLLDEDDDDDDPGSVDTLNAFAYALTPDHFVSFRREGPALLVSFEIETDPAIALKSRRSRLAGLVEDMAWSHLVVTSRRPSLFRAPEIVTFFDALVDGTLLDQFDDVLFYGEGCGGHAALSYALAAPMSRILAIAPLVGLDGAGPVDDPRLGLPEGAQVGGRYAPDTASLAVAAAVHLVLDPAQPQDLAQAGAVAGERVQPLFVRDPGAPLPAALAELGILDEIIGMAMEGSLDGPSFYGTLRKARRDDPAYLRRLTARLIEKNRLLLEALAVRNVAERTGRKRFAKRLEHLEARLAEQGQTLPPARSRPVDRAPGGSAT
ncbi:hypothetical protein [Oceaniglobus roseus]|uniref:hypothetical protein n=1 Tax=Oceaniglobus roseus TaxID=1737570 RepID=UPI000C7F26B3|nr:hypothetical protein [Kandeliimicrobium roseum]